LLLVQVVQERLIQLLVRLLHTLVVAVDGEELLEAQVELVEAAQVFQVTVLELLELLTQVAVEEVLILMLLEALEVLAL
jgi:hypothetical protein